MPAPPRSAKSRSHGQMKPPSFHQPPESGTSSSSRAATTPPGVTEPEKRPIVDLTLDNSDLDDEIYEEIQIDRKLKLEDVDMQIEFDAPTTPTIRNQAAPPLHSSSPDLGDIADRYNRQFLQQISATNSNRPPRSHFKILSPPIEAKYSPTWSPSPTLVHRTQDKGKGKARMRRDDVSDRMDVDGSASVQRQDSRASTLATASLPSRRPQVLARPNAPEVVSKPIFLPISLVSQRIRS